MKYFKMFQIRLFPFIAFQSFQVKYFPEHFGTTCWQVRRDQPRGKRSEARAQSTTHWWTSRPIPLGPDTVSISRITKRFAEQPRDPSTIRTVPDTLLWTDSTSGQWIVRVTLLELLPVSPVAGKEYNKI